MRGGTSRGRSERGRQGRKKDKVWGGRDEGRRIYIVVFTLIFGYYDLVGI